MAYVTDLMVSTSEKEIQVLQGDNFTKVPGDLKEGTSVKNVFLWIKKGDKENAITRVQVTYNEYMEEEMEETDYIKIDKNVNHGTSGPSLYIWYSRAKGDYDVPIVDVAITVKPFDQAAKLTSGGIWEAVNCDLNLGITETCVYAWLKREKPIYIHQVTATVTYELHDLLMSAGFTRVDVSTNLSTAGDPVFIWYRKTTDEKNSLSVLKIANSEAQKETLKKDGYTLVKADLNKGTFEYPLYLLSKKEELDHVSGIFLMRNTDALPVFQAGGIKVIEQNLNNKNTPIYLCYN